jgi:hypothetical protein
MEASAFVTVCEHFRVVSLGIIKVNGSKYKQSQNDSLQDILALKSTADVIEQWVKHYFEYCEESEVNPTSHG